RQLVRMLAVFGSAYLEEVVVTGGQSDRRHDSSVFAREKVVTRIDGELAAGQLGVQDRPSVDLNEIPVLIARRREIAGRAGLNGIGVRPIVVRFLFDVGWTRFDRRGQGVRARRPRLEHPVVTG